MGDHKQFTTQHVGVKSLFEVLHDHGWSNAVFYSSHYDYTNFRDFLRGRNIGEMYDADTMPGERRTKPVSWGLREEETLIAMQQYIQRCAQSKERFFMSYIPAAPHYPYDGTPERFRKFVSKEYNDYTERYLNDLLYMDWVVASILDELRDNGLLDKTLVVITGDHGEMLGAGGGPIGHGWEITPELVNVPLIVMDPSVSGAQINTTIGSHVDLLPTILDKLGIPLPTQQLYQGCSLYSSSAQTDRTIYLNSFAKFGVLQGRTLTIGSRKAKQASHHYEIENDGARTIYRSMPVPPEFGNPIALFDQFQPNFLRNYSHYGRIVTGTENLASRPNTTVEADRHSSEHLVTHQP